MRITFHHMHVICKDLEPMVAFWRDALGAELVNRRKMGAADGAEMRIDGNISLFIRGQSPADINSVAVTPDSPVLYSSFDHIGYAVDDLDATLEFLTKRDDVVLTRPPFVAGANRCAFIRGPEGINIELMQLGCV